MNISRVVIVFISFVVGASTAAAQQPQLARDYVYGPMGRLAVTIEPDYYGPYSTWITAALTLECAIDGIDVEWGTATDIGSGTDYYTLYRDGSWLGDFTGHLYHDSDVSATETYSYTVVAVDKVENDGDTSPAAQVYVPLCWPGGPFGGGGEEPLCAVCSQVRIGGIPFRQPSAFQRALQRVRLYWLTPPRTKRPAAAAVGGAL